jgi:hypothetical protein
MVNKSIETDSESCSITCGKLVEAISHKEWEEAREYALDLSTNKKLKVNAELGVDFMKNLALICKSRLEEEKELFNIPC